MKRKKTAISATAIRLSSYEKYSNDSNPSHSIRELFFNMILKFSE